MTPAARAELAGCFGKQAANHFIAAVLDDQLNREQHLARYSRIERQFAEWWLAEYAPECVP